MTRGYGAAGSGSHGYAVAGIADAGSSTRNRTPEKKKIRPRITRTNANDFLFSEFYSRDSPARQQFLRLRRSALGNSSPAPATNSCLFVPRLRDSWLAIRISHFTNFPLSAQSVVSVVVCCPTIWCSSPTTAPPEPAKAGSQSPSTFFLRTSLRHFRRRR
jgi:hypothetical protein